MLIYAATKNAGKMRELRDLGEPLGWEVLAYGAYHDVVEDADSYVGNATLKARVLVRQLDEAQVPYDAVLGDDSGLEVEVLGGRPGMFSARYGPPGASWAERRRLLLDEVGATGDARRAARFICAIVLVDGAGREFESIGEVGGAIAPEERGDEGFSYDAIFVYPPLEMTFGELAEPQKNRVSHRARAMAGVAARYARMETSSSERISVDE